MTERTLKYRNGLFLIAIHLTVVVLVIVLRLLGGFDGEQLTTLLAVIIPMFAGYSTAIVSFIIKDRHNREDRTQIVSGAFVALSFVFPTLFAAAILVGILCQAYNVAFENFEDFKTFLLAMETIFGLYVGRFVYSMFEREGTPGPEQSAGSGSVG